MPYITDEHGLPYCAAITAIYDSVEDEQHHRPRQALEIHGRMIIAVPVWHVINITTNCPHELLDTTGTNRQLETQYPHVIFSTSYLYGVDNYMETARQPPQPGGPYYGHNRDPKIFGWHRLNPFKFIDSDIGHLLDESEIPNYYPITISREAQRAEHDEKFSL